MAVENEVKKSTVSSFDCEFGPSGLNFDSLTTKCREWDADRKKERYCTRYCLCALEENSNARDSTREKSNAPVGQIANRPLNFGKMY